MRKMGKKVLPTLLAVSMVCGSVSPAFAADLFSADEEDIVAESVEFSDESAGAAKESAKVLEWDYGNAHSVTVEVGTELTSDQFIDQTNARNCVKKNGQLATGGIEVRVDSHHWNQVRTSKVGVYKVDLYASDDDGNETWNMGLSVNVVDTTAPQWNYGGDINYTISVPVGTSLMSADEFIEASNVKNNVFDNSGEELIFTYNTWAWGQIDTSVVRDHRIEVYATDASGNTSDNIGITLSVVDEEAPVWNYGGITHTLEIPVGTELTAADFIAMTGADLNVSDNYTSVENIKIEPDSWQWENVFDTSKTGKFKIDLYAYDESGNKSYNLGITVTVVDKIAPVWNYGGITHTLEIPVGTELTVADFIAMTGADLNVSDNYTSVENIKIEPDSWQWENVFDTSKTGKFKIDLYAYDESGNKSYNLGITVTVVPTTKEVPVIFMLSNGEVVDDTTTVTVEAGAIKYNVTKDSVTVPKNFNLVSEGIADIIDGKIYVQVAQKTKKVTVVYRTSDKKVVDREVVKVPVDAKKVKISDLTAPKGYTIISTRDASINRSIAYVTVKRTTKKVNIVFKTKDGETVETRPMEVNATTKYINVNDLKAKDGYTIISTGRAYFDKNGNAVVWVKRTTKDVKVVFRTKEGRIIESRDMEVSLTTKYIKLNGLKAPKGYCIVKNKSIASINEKGTAYVTVERVRR